MPHLLCACAVEGNRFLGSIHYLTPINQPKISIFECFFFQKLWAKLLFSIDNPKYSKSDPAIASMSCFVWDGVIFKVICINYAN